MMDGFLAICPAPDHRRDALFFKGSVAATPGDADRLFRGPLFRRRRSGGLWHACCRAPSSGDSGDCAAASNICCQIPRPL